MQILKKPITIITGHYGSGKTNAAVNLALSAAQSGQAVTIIDLDIVNPYFRTADFVEPLKAHDIQVIAPVYANSNLDIPVLPASVDAAFSQSDRQVIVDVGGDDAGAIALGRYAKKIEAQGYEMLYVINARRYLTKNPAEAVELLREIEQAARLSATGILNNTNLGAQTTAQTVLDSLPFAQAVCEQTGLPLVGTCTTQTVSGLPCPFPVKRLVKSPWEISGADHTSL